MFGGVETVAIASVPLPCGSCGLDSGGQVCRQVL